MKNDEKDIKELAVEDLLRKVEEHDKEILSRGITPNAIKRPIYPEDVSK